MGYRSEVVIKVNDELQKEFKELCEKLEYEQEENGTLHLEDVKWYKGACGFEDVNAMEDWLSSQAGEDYGFLRIGDDNDDIEYKGEPYAFGIYLTRSIEF